MSLTDADDITDGARAATIEESFMWIYRVLVAL